MLRPGYIPPYWLFVKHADGGWPGPWSALARLAAPLATGPIGMVLITKDHDVAFGVVGLVACLLSVVQLLLFGPNALRALRWTRTRTQ